MPMVNLTMGNPYVSIHVTRPYDMGKYIPDEHPLYGIARMIHGIGEVKKAVPQMAISASAPTYLRQYSDLYAAGAIEEVYPLRIRIFQIRSGIPDGSIPKRCV